jgi:tetrahydromethanopterin S-methyltransferase subunit D
MTQNSEGSGGEVIGGLIGLLLGGAAGYLAYKAVKGVAKRASRGVERIFDPDAEYYQAKRKAKLEAKLRKLRRSLEEA